MSSSDSFMQFSTNNNGYMDSTKEFFSSNSLIAKVSFLLLVIFVFVILIRLGISLLGYFYSGSSTTKLINGMVDAKQLMVFPQDPSIDGAKTIDRSVNATDGVEFTWSVWLMIDDLTYNQGKYKCVFYKGNDNSGEQGLNFPNNAPGLYITPELNNLLIVMNTFNVINEEIIVSDIPLNKWFNVIIKCENTNLDVYINGTIAKSHKLHGVPKQNYGEVFVAKNGGFSGYISNLWYYSYALGTSAIQRIMSDGPNTKMTGDTSPSAITPSNYLSLRWYFNGTGDQYNT